MPTLDLDEDCKTGAQACQACACEVSGRSGGRRLSCLFLPKFWLPPVIPPVLVPLPVPTIVDFRIWVIWVDNWANWWTTCTGGLGGCLTRIMPFGNVMYVDHWSFFGSWWLNGFLNNNGAWFGASVQILPFVFGQGWSPFLAPSIIWSFANAFHLGIGDVYGRSMYNLVDQVGFAGADGRCSFSPVCAGRNKGRRDFFFTLTSACPREPQAASTSTNQNQNQNQTVMGNAMALADKDSSTYDGLLKATITIFCETPDPPRAWMVAMSVAVNITNEVPCRLMSEGIGGMASQCPDQLDMLARDPNTLAVMRDCKLLPDDGTGAATSAGGLDPEKLRQVATDAPSPSAPGKGAGSNDEPNLTAKWPVCVQLGAAAGMPSVKIRSRPCSTDGAVLGSWKAGTRLAAATGKAVPSSCKGEASRWVHVRYNGQRAYAMTSPTADAASAPWITPCASAKNGGAVSKAKTASAGPTTSATTAKTALRNASAKRP